MMGQAYASELQEILTKNEPLLRAISNSEFSFKSTPNKWSKKEILGHLIDSAFNNYQRFIRAENKEDLIFEGYAQDEWVVKNNYQNRDKKEIVALFIAVNRHIAYMIASLNKDILLKSVTNHNLDQIGMRPIGKNEPTSLGYLIEDYIFHLKHHLRQIVG